jgi:hypothetical protein
LACFVRICEIAAITEHYGVVVHRRPGLDGGAEAQANEILGNSTEPTVQAQYQEILHKRARE